ncbi:MAG TPA: hypothetical protein VFW02_04080 [Candidatus Limnocylindrales bacterium]|nr:hypothetical protein [Candidatus Limnocylindrales bacterium]
MQGPAKPSPRAWLAADLAVKLVTVALLAWAVFNQNLPQFHDKAFEGRAVAYPVALLLLPLGWWVFGSRTIRFPFAADILFGLPFLIDVVGNALNLYDTIEWWDDANHLVNWALHTSAVGLLLRYGGWSRPTRAALAFGYAVTTAVLWEFAEYVTFVPNSPEAASAYADTLFDLALGMLGGMVAAFVTSRMPAKPARWGHPPT